MEGQGKEVPPHGRPQERPVYLLEVCLEHMTEVSLRLVRVEAKCEENRGIDVDLTHVGTNPRGSLRTVRADRRPPSAVSSIL